MRCPSCHQPFPSDATFCDSCGAQVGSLVGTTLGGKFVITRKLGEGGFGAVYEAEEKRLQRKVAIKTLHDHVSKNPDISKRFLQEAVATSRLEHPNIVKVYDYGELPGGAHWMAMEYLTGQPLDSYLQQKKVIPLEELLSLMGPICEALGEAHQKNLVHRDLKPQNIMLISIGGKLVPKVLDFGISKLEDSDSKTQSGMMMGTPQYMPPEQWEGAGKATAASDVYALGVMLYQMLAGRLPFVADSKYAWLTKHCQEIPAPLTDYVQHPSAPALSEVVMRCLAKKPYERYPDASALKRALEKALSGLPGTTPQPAVASQAETMAHTPSPTPNTGKTQESPDEQKTSESARCSRCEVDHRQGSPDCPASRLHRVIAGKYKLTKLLGAGGMGAVYQAEHLMLKKQVALKMLLPRYASNEQVNKRFEEEARRASNLKHPGIIEVTDLGRDKDGSAYMEMELLQGHSISELLQKESIPVEEAITIFTEALEALSFAHQRGIIHRDLKPDNLFRARQADGSYRTKILDFGIAKVIEGEEGALTQTGSIMGTPFYMSLEQASDTKRVDQRSDIYSLGATFFEILTRRRPISGETINELLTQLIEDRVERHPKKFREDIPGWLDSLIERSMAKKPEERFQSASELLVLLKEKRELAPLKPSAELVVHKPADSISTLPVEPRPSTSRQGPLLLGLVVVLGGVLGVILWPKAPTQTTPPPKSTPTPPPPKPEPPPLCIPATKATKAEGKGEAVAGRTEESDPCKEALLLAKEDAIKKALCLSEEDAVTSALPAVPPGCEGALQESIRTLSWKAQITEGDWKAEKSDSEGGKKCEVTGTFRVLPLPPKRKCEIEVVQFLGLKKESLSPPGEEYIYTASERSERKKNALYLFSILPGGEVIPAWGEGAATPFINKNNWKMVEEATGKVTRFDKAMYAPLEVGFETSIFANNGVPAGSDTSCELMLAVGMPQDKALRVFLREGKGQESERLLQLMSQIESSAGSLEETCWTFLPYQVSKK